MTQRFIIAIFAGFAILSLCLLAAFAQSWIPSGEAQERASQGNFYFQQGEQMAQAGDFAGAADMYKKSIGFDPRNKIVVYHLALALEAAGNQKAAVGWFLGAMDLDYNFVECRNDYAVMLLKMGKRDDAEQQFRLCIQINPKFPNAYEHLGNILQQKGDLDGAIENYETATRLKPDYYDAQKDLGLAIFERSNQGDIENSLDKLLAAERLVPTNPMIHLHLAAIYCALGKLDEGEKELRQALMIDPRMAFAHWELARLRYFRGDLDRCLAEIDQAQKINPDYAQMKKYPPVDPIVMQKMIAACLEFKGEKLQAIDAWKTVAAESHDSGVILAHVQEMEKAMRQSAKRKQVPLTYDPAEVDALVQKGIGQYEDGDLDSAKASFERASELNPNSFEGMQNQGAVLEAEGDLTGAITKYQQAMALCPQYDGAYYNLAYVLEKANLPADAGMMYEKFHEIAGKYPYDPKHIVSIQQEDARQKAREYEKKKRGY